MLVRDFAAIFQPNLTTRSNSYNFVRAANDTVCANPMKNFCVVAVLAAALAESSH
jgi:hypothetical protein